VAAPYTLRTHIVRAHKARDPYAFSPFRQEYIFLFGTEERVGSAEFPWDEALMEDLAETLGPRPEGNRVQRLGEKLRTFLEEGLSKHQGWATHEAAILREVEANQPVHIVFRFEAAELYSLPWELVALGSSGQHLGALPGCLIQYEWPGAGAVPPLPAGFPPRGRVLFGWSAAGGPVPAERHLRALTQAATRGAYGFDAHQDVVPHLSLEGLSRALEEASRAGRPVNILHLLCHGARTAEGTTGLRWNARRPEDPPELIDAAALRRVLAPYKETLRLVVLCACHGGDASAPGNVLGGVAQELHRQGLAAVVASRMLLSVEGSVLLTESLYGALEGPDSIRLALLAAKRALAGTSGYDWASLQLYARAEDAAPVARPRPAPWKLAAVLAAVACVLGVLGLGLSRYLEPPAVVPPARVETPPSPGPLVEEQPLAGQVFDEEDQPVADATVIVRAGGDILKGQTDADGYFKLVVRAERQLSVDFMVKKPGYKDYEGTANLGNTGLGFALDRSEKP
jgi:hypothetical protein